MHIQLKDELGIIKAAAKLLAGGGDAAGNRLQGGFLLRFRLFFACFCLLFTTSRPAIDHLFPWANPGLAPDLTKRVSVSVRSRVDLSNSQSGNLPDIDRFDRPNRLKHLHKRADLEFPLG